MELKVYVDVLFITNFIFDFLLLYIAGVLLHSLASTRRLALAATFGALYALFAFFLPHNILLLLPCKLIAGSVMVTIAFPSPSFRLWIQHLTMFYAVSFLSAGATFGLFSLTDAFPAGSALRNGAIYMNIPIYKPLLTAFIIVPCIKPALSLAIKAAHAKKDTATLLVSYRGKSLTLRAFYDSGNFLQDAVTGKGVIIANWQWAKPFFADCKAPEDTQKLGTIPIYYHTLCASSHLYAFWPDAIYIKNKHHFTQVETAYIALIDKALNHHYNWDAILPRNFKGEIHHETQLTSDSVSHRHTPKATPEKVVF